MTKQTTLEPVNTLRCIKVRDYLNYIDDNHPIRRDNSEKKAFRNFVEEEACSSAYKCEPRPEPQTKRKAFCCQVETDNIIIGDINSAEVIFTAHYDTPASSIIPNMILPRHRWMKTLYSLFLGVLALLPFVIRLIRFFPTIPMLGMQDVLWASGFYVLHHLLTGHFTNAHNKNDNTSGVATVLSLVKRCTSKKVAFVLFDNEERGLRGSKAFRKRLPKDTLVINFDCVGVGNNVLFIAKKAAMKHRLYNKLKKHNQSNNGFKVLFYPERRASSDSDHKTFECSIGVVTCKKKWGIYYTGKIHTNRDTEAYAENIDFLAENMARFVDDLS